jgi:SAM-dependent methyltransferase
MEKQPVGFREEFWDERYKGVEYAYGTAPNLFFKQALDEFQIRGKILLPAEGEGRNGVYAAQQGLEVTAFDISKEGKRKALLLANEQNVTLDYQINGFDKVLFMPNTFDAIGIFFVHIPYEKRKQVYNQWIKYLKPGGYIVLEEYSKENAKHKAYNPKIGGPENIEMLNSAKEIIELFPHFEHLILEEKEREMSEGSYHVGTGAVVQFIGRKL